MLVSDLGIVIKNIPYKTNQVISKIYTSSYGLITAHFYVGKSKSSKIKPSNIQPLSQIEVEFKHNENKEIYQVSDIHHFYIYQSLNIDVSKICISQFLNEMLYKSLKPHIQNENLFNYLITSFQWLDKAESNFSQFHVYFLLQLARHFGFYPQNNYSIYTPYFNLVEGSFQSFEMAYPVGIDMHLSQIFSNCLNENYTLTKQDKNNMLDTLLLYFKYHYIENLEVKSLEILKEVLS